MRCAQGNDVREGSTGSSSPQHSREDDEDEEVPKVEMEEDIPLAKTGFPLTSAFPPIQVCGVCVYVCACGGGGVCVCVCMFVCGVWCGMLI